MIKQISRKVDRIQVAQHKVLVQLELPTDSTGEYFHDLYSERHHRVFCFNHHQCIRENVQRRMRSHWMRIYINNENRYRPS